MTLLLPLIRPIAVAVCLFAPIGLASGDTLTSPVAKDGKKPDAPITTGINWRVKPAEVEVFLDGRKLGVAGSLTYTEARAGGHTVRLVNGGDEEELEIRVVKGQVIRIAFTFSE
jgi:hypothetical protein